MYTLFRRERLLFENKYHFVRMVASVIIQTRYDGV